MLFAEKTTFLKEYKEIKVFYSATTLRWLVLQLIHVSCNTYTHGVCVLAEFSGVFIMDKTSWQSQWPGSLLLSVFFVKYVHNVYALCIFMLLPKSTSVIVTLFLTDCCVSTKYSTNWMFLAYPLSICKKFTFKLHV